jgi:hypothetical protein
MFHGTHNKHEFLMIAIDSIRSLYVTDRKRKKFRVKASLTSRFMTLAPNTEFCTIDTTDSLRSKYDTGRKGENHFESKHRSLMFHATNTKH